MSKRQAELRESWRQRIVEQQKSGQSIRAFCRERGVGEHSFYHWRQWLGQSEVPVKFALVETKPVAQSAVMELVLVGGEVLRIPAEAASLRLVLEALRQPARFIYQPVCACICAPRPAICGAASMGCMH